MPTPSLEEPTLLLTQHAFLAAAHNCLVILDVKKDRYIQLEGEHIVPVATQLGLTLANAHSSPDRHSHAKIDTQVNNIVARLIEHGLVTRDFSIGKKAKLLQATQSLHEAPGFRPDASRQATRGDIINLCVAYCVTTFQLHILGLESTIRRLRNRQSSQTDHSSTAEKKLLDTLELYKRMRPLFLRIKDNCLFNAVFLVEFLARYGIFAELWVGVRVNAFEAHAWVQHDGALLDDFIYNVSENRPILTV